MQEDHTQIIETPRSKVETTPHTDVRDVQTAPRSTEVHTVVPRADMDRVEAVAYDPFEGRRNAGYRLTQLVYWVFGLIEGLVAIRFVLKALGANPSAGFAEFIYSITAPLVAPFTGLFANPQYQGTVLELSSIIAFFVYALVGWLIARLVWIVMGETRSAIRTRSTHVDSRI